MMVSMLSWLLNEDDRQFSEMGQNCWRSKVLEGD